MTITGQHLRGRHRMQAECLAHDALHPRVDVGVRANGTRQLAHGNRSTGLTQSLTVPIGLQAPERHLHPERGRLGVHTMGAPDHHRVAMLERELLERAHELVGGLQHPV